MTIVLPGCVMHYNRNRAVDKVVALLWALYLVVGLDEQLLQWVINLITSVTHDMGTESGILDVPNIFPKFFRSLLGVPVSLGVVDPLSRVFPNALRQPGWCHLFANLIKGACHCIRDWPLLLESTRKLCEFLRNDSWRAQVVARLEGVYPECRKLLKSFTASLNKWRYATIWIVFNALIPLRFLFEHYLRDLKHLFPSFQDSSLLEAVQAAARWGDLWIFFATFQERIANRCELARRWGLVCYRGPIRPRNQFVPRSVRPNSQFDGHCHFESRAEAQSPRQDS